MKKSFICIIIIIIIIIVCYFYYYGNKTVKIDPKNDPNINPVTNPIVNPIINSKNNFVCNHQNHQNTHVNNHQNTHVNNHQNHQNHQNNFTTKENPVYPSSIPLYGFNNKHPVVYDADNLDHLIHNINSKFSEKKYPGSIDNEIPNLGLSKDSAESIPAFYGFGYKDLAKSENAKSPEGNAFNTMRISAPVAAPIKIDEEDNADTLDYDELNTYQAKWRNDATRVTAGTMNRQRDLDPYLREELDETENEIWWSQNEI